MFHSEAQRKLVMSKANRMKQDGFTAYSVVLKRKLKVTPRDRIEIMQRKLKNHNTAVIMKGKTPHGTVVRIVGQF
jgi:hypothetical protein